MQLTCLHQVVKDPDRSRSPTEQPFQATRPTHAFAESISLPDFNSQVLCRLEVASRERNVSGVSCPCQPSPRFFLVAGFAGHFACVSWQSRVVDTRQCGDEGNRTPDLL